MPTSLTLLFPLGRYFGAIILLHGGSLGENPVLWTSNDGASGVVLSLEALSLETQLSVGFCQSFVHSGFS